MIEVSTQNRNLTMPWGRVEGAVVILLACFLAMILFACCFYVTRSSFVPSQSTQL